MQKTHHYFPPSPINNSSDELASDITIRMNQESVKSQEGEELTNSTSYATAILEKGTQMKQINLRSSSHNTSVIVETTYEHHGNGAGGSGTKAQTKKVSAKISSGS